MRDTFYKYRSDSEYTEDLFTSGKVCLATASGLNDPFECSFEDIGRDWIFEQVSKMKQASIAGFIANAMSAKRTGEHFFRIPGPQIDQLLNEMSQQGDLDKAYEFYVSFIADQTGRPPSDCGRFFSGLDAQLNEVGIFRMAATPDNALMWAHYAKDSGVCIGFQKSAGSRMASAEHFLPVIYSDALPALDKEGSGSLADTCGCAGGGLVISVYSQRVRTIPGGTP